MTPHNILIIDDEPVISEGCRLVLSEAGHRVQACATGRTGLEAILQGPHDIALLDLRLPDMDGMEVLRAARERRPEVYIIVITGFSTVQNAVEAMKLGAFDYLSKPFGDDELLLAVERAAEKKRLVEENLTLRRELLDRFGFHNIVGENPKMLRIYDQIRKVAPQDSTVILYGESGTGKELFARAIHAHSQRAVRQFLAMDCGSLAPGLMESELFGHVRGAFTGAVEDKAGLFEMANGGTLFLDDVANLSPELQGKLLRVLESREYKPVGASRIKKTDVRIISATNRDLRAMAQEGSFREDLYFRLNVFPIFLPPLRERKDDVPRLAYSFLRLLCRQTAKRIEGFSEEALAVLVNHNWPGNVRELKNVVERLVILAERGILDHVDVLDHLSAGRSLKETQVPQTLEEMKAFKRSLLQETYGEMEKAFVLRALQASHGNIARAAERVGMQRSNFHALMKKHRLTAKRFKEMA